MYVIRDKLKYRAKVRTKSQLGNTGFADGLRKVLHPCFEKYLLPNGIISSEIAEELERQERQQHAYRLPHMEEEVDRVLWWMYNK